jgi:hypothetical protein
MSGPFIFIATNRLKTSRLEDEKKRVPELAEFIETNEPRLAGHSGMPPWGQDERGLL